MGNALMKGFTDGEHRLSLLVQFTLVAFILRNPHTLYQFIRSRTLPPPAAPAAAAAAAAPLLLASSSSSSASSASSASAVFLTLLRTLNSHLSVYQPWQLILASLVCYHALSNASLLLGLNPPHHSLIADMPYSPAFTRVRVLLTALDAGVLSTHHIRFSSLLRHTLSIVLSAIWLFFPSHADRTVQQYRSSINIDQLRACWEKGQHPVVRFVTSFTRVFVPYERVIYIDVPPAPAEAAEQPAVDGEHDEADGESAAVHRSPVHAATAATRVECTLFYYQSDASQLQHERRLVLDVPGGGFVSQSPAHHADYLSLWCMRLRVPVLAINYRKAPAHPFPAGLLDCYHVYKAIVDSNGAVIGINTATPTASAPPSAQAAAQAAPAPSDLSPSPTSQHHLPHQNGVSTAASSPAESASPLAVPPLVIALVGDSAGGNLATAVTLKAMMEGLRVPDGVHLIYPCLDLAAEVWKPSTTITSTTKLLPSRSRSSLTSPAMRRSSSTTTLLPIPSPTASSDVNHTLTDSDDPQSAQLSSRSIYAQDGVLPLRYQFIIGEAYLHRGGDPKSDILISPLRASLELLHAFPPTYTHVGGADPLIDDSVMWHKKLTMASRHKSTLYIIPRISHAYLQVAALLPEGNKALNLSVQWLQEILDSTPGAVPAATATITAHTAALGSTAATSLSSSSRPAITRSYHQANNHHQFTHLAHHHHHNHHQRHQSSSHSHAHAATITT